MAGASRHPVNGPHSGLRVLLLCAVLLPGLGGCRPRNPPPETTPEVVAAAGDVAIQRTGADAVVPEPAEPPADAARSVPADVPADSTRWIVRNPGPTTQTLRTVAWMSAEEAWAAGERGAVVRSTDGGATWSLVDVPRAAMWIAVGRAADDAVWLAGLDGTRLRSADDGASWEVIVEAPPDGAETAEAFDRWRRTRPGRLLVDRWGRSWLVAGALERIDGRSIRTVGTLPGWPSTFAWATEDRCFSGGGRFDLVHLVVSTPGLEGVRMEHPGFLLRSDDGGATWPEGGLELQELHLRYTVFGADGSGLAIGGDAFVPEPNRPLRATADAGGTWGWGEPWAEATGDPPKGPAELCVPDERERRVRCTWDGGKTWHGGPFPGPVPGCESNPDGRAVAIRDLRHVLAVGGFGSIFRAEGERWVSRNSGPVPHLADVAMDGEFAVAVGGGVLVSHDRGVTWSEAPVPAVELPDGQEFLAGWDVVAVVGDRRAWVGAGAGGVTATEDGGATWADRSDGLPAVGLGGDDFDPSLPGIGLLRFLDERRGLASARKRLFRTEDAGGSWTPVELPGGAEWSPTLLAVLPATPEPIVLLSDFRTVWRSTDGGRTFLAAMQGLAAPREASAVSLLLAAGPGEAFLADGSSVLRSTDGGATWSAWGFLRPEPSIGAAVLPDGGLALFQASGAALRVEASAVWVEPTVLVEGLPGVMAARIVFDGPLTGILVGAGGLIATLGR